ncbi:MAG TPA: PIN domain-containing protein [Candidatus Methanoperedens sp.]|nr:PIN domain-containing protein [Candidatus Methanoperedens sp.]
MNSGAGTKHRGAVARAVAVAAGAALGAAAPVLLVAALREPDGARAAVFAALGAAALALAGVALGAAALDWLRPLAGSGAAAGTVADTGGRTAAGGAATLKILDTSVIIDGRIADVCEAGFIEGTLVVPTFVLAELQAIADSPDPLRRNRGRRGLDVLARMQKRPDLAVVVGERDFPLLREVDAKLVALARETGGRIITNDANLGKVAGVSGVAVLSLNQLAGALRPAALPGEVMRVTLLKEGKEAGQGVAYLDDGTMVVVDGGRRLIGRSLDVVVTSAIQTAAGRMIFAQLRETAREGGAAPGEAAP